MPSSKLAADLIEMEIGAKQSQDSCEFRVWAPLHNKVCLVFPEKKQVLKMDSAGNGYWQLTVNGIKPETRYLYRLSSQIDRADPASHFQPDGALGPSAVVDHSSFVWKDSDWRGISLKDMIIYELHVGAFSEEGTFAAASKRAEELSKMGVNAVELMPVAQFSGSRNWGYDAVFPYAVQNTYGGPDELKKLVQEFHLHGMAVVLDVVYNHLGPEGNFLRNFGPYFLVDLKTPWGPAVNFDGPLSFHVRNFFLQNAVHWFRNYHVDGLRLDAVYAIIDKSRKHFLRELSETVENLRSRRKLLLIAENDRVDPRLIGNKKRGGYGLDALWHDNLHHALHAALTGERNWYYAAFGSMRKLIEALQTGHAGCIQRRMPMKTLGDCSLNSIEPRKLVVFSQNHDQIGNRPRGERLITLAGLEAARLAAAIVILSQNTPLLFMGEEYGEAAPFLFFTDYSDQLLGKKVRIGRKREFAQNGWKGRAADPQGAATFTRSKIDWRKRHKGRGEKILSYYQRLIDLRRTLNRSQPNKGVYALSFTSKGESLLVIQKQMPNSTAAFIANFGKRKCRYRFPCAGEDYVKVLDSADKAWGGLGSDLSKKTKLGDEQIICPLSIAVYLIQRKAKNND